MHIEKTWIRLEDIRLFAYHGVCPQERSVGAYYHITLRIDVDFSRGLCSDRLEDTVSYADIFSRVREEMAIPSALLEHAAGRILKRLFLDFDPIRAANILLTKENPPMSADCQGAGVEISAHR